MSADSLANQIDVAAFLPIYDNSISLTTYRPVRKIKIEQVGQVPSLLRQSDIIMLYVASQYIQELIGAFFKYENAVFNGVQEKESIICVRKG